MEEPLDESLSRNNEDESQFIGDFFNFGNNANRSHFNSGIFFGRPQGFSDEEKKDYYEDPHVYFKNYNEESHPPGDGNFLKDDDNLDIFIKRDDAHGDRMVEESPEHGIKEEMTSSSTRPSPYIRSREAEFGHIPIKLEENLTASNSLTIEIKIKAAVSRILETKSKDEAEYIFGIFSSLVVALDQICSKQELEYLNDTFLERMISQLIENEKNNSFSETMAIRTLVQDELKNLPLERPDTIIENEALFMNRRKVKKILKGNKNSSSLNHINENYVSNIFQFAKKYFPDDKEIQRIANERNVSAVNFKRLVRIKLGDSALVKRAKLRIKEIGNELLGHIEYWMSEGYFDQCNEREKYIINKAKALVDLGLDSHLDLIETMA
jgi:hypothetical protein